MTMTIGSVQSEVEAHLSAIGVLYGRVNDGRPAECRLSPRELQAAVLYATTPVTLSELGRRMHVSKSTVRTLLGRATAKLQVERRSELPAALARVTDGVAA
jgi:DNA-binding CsgD family transcriptional regulator